MSVIHVTIEHFFKKKFRKEDRVNDVQQVAY